MSEVAGVEEKHVQESIEPHHFTPFASLLYHLPTAVREVFGNFSTQFYWSYNTTNRALDVDIYWVSEGEGFRTARKLTCVQFNRTAYSYGQIVAALSTKKVYNTSTVENV